MRIIGNRETCASSSLCVYALPEIFDQDEDEGLIVVVEEHPSEELYEAVRHAVRSCPTRSLRIVETADAERK